MEGLGKKLKEARLARGLTLDEAGRLTKIRPGRLEEIENEDFSQFASLAYAKGFLLIYGKFLDVDVTPYLEAFETSESVTVDGYSYLQDAPDPEPIRPVTVRRRSSSSSSVGSSGPRASLMPLIIGVLVLVIGFTLMKWFLQMQRLKPRPTPAPGTSPVATATATDKIIAPHAQPAETTTPAPQPSDTPPAVSPTPATAATIPFVPAPAPAEPEVRRAEPVHPEDASAIPTPTPSPKRSPRRTSPTPKPNISGTPRPIATPTVRPR
ncbi:MAG TPA: helix-turn-helix domain-containing protein [Chthoniobacterales bacterium]|nr:helix-turn-helix domain-containing protein [Chthoniobacterales bacterium]